MTILEFIAEIVTALIWPVTALIILLVLRRSILDLIPRLTRLTYGEFELEFDQQLAEVAAQAEIANLPAADGPPLLRAAEKAAATAAKTAEMVYPKGAILEAWETVEDVLDEMLNRRADRPKARSARAKAQQLVQEGVLDGHELQMLTNLWGLRNMAAHEKDFQPTPQQAAEYSRLADRLIKGIEKG